MSGPPIDRGFLAEPERTTRTSAIRALARLVLHPRALARTGLAVVRAALEGGALGWKAMLREATHAGEVLDYQTFVAREAPKLAADEGALRARLAAFDVLPRISVVVLGEEGRAQTEASLAAQLFAAHEVVRSSEDAQGEYLISMKSGDRLPRHALAVFALATRAAPAADLIYSDHDHLSARGRRVDPVFKPGWSPELYEAHDYIGPARLLRRASDEAASSVVHLPFVLYHARERARTPSRAPALAEVAPPAPFVSILIPTRDRVHLLRRCIESLRARTDYPAYEIVLVDNGSRDPAALSYLGELEAGGSASVLRDDRPFHFGALNNAAVARARGDVLVLLNNDVEIVERSWLRELVAYAVRPEIGAVGAKLLYPNGRVQHAGVVLGMHGVAGHVFKGLRADAPGYGALAALPRNVSAVTAACLAIRKSVYQAVDGFDEAHLGVEYGDVDLCLRVMDAGYRNVFTPRALLVHHESGSRGKDETPEARERGRAEYAYMVRRYGERLTRDPFWSPNLSLHSESVALANPPRTTQGGPR